MSSQRSEIEHPPVPPTNVRIVRPDGTEVPCEVRFVKTYIADDGEPMHDWEAISEYLPQIPQDRIAMDTLPPRTGIGFTFHDPTRGSDGS